MILQVYLAGPYTGDDSRDVVRNVAQAVEVAAQVIDAGAYPVTSHPIGLLLQRGVGTPEYWYAATLEQMRRCDCVLTVPGWLASAGAKAEVAEAHRLGIPVYHSVRQLAETRKP